MTTLSFIKLRFISLSLLVFLTSSLCYCGEKQLYFFGGGGEPDGPTTIFDSHINLVSQFINNPGSNWTASHSFNGGHADTEKRLQSRLQNANSLGAFDEKNFLDTLSDLEKKIKSGELVAGDQLLLIVDTHGAMPSKSQKTHSIALSSGAAQNLKTLSGARTISMDKLESIANLASEKGVKLAVVDLSCFSGNTLKIANKNICVISASGEYQYGYSELRTGNDNSPYSTFNGRFMERMKPGANLESIFLNARAGTTSPDFPMISTNTGLIINDLIYKMITPYLVYNEASTTDFSESYDTKNLAMALCKTENQYSEIQKRIEDLSSLTEISKKLLDTSKLKLALTAYRDYQVYYEKALGNTQKAGEEVKSIIARDYPDKAKLFDKEDGLSILTANRESSLKVYKDLAETSKSESTKKFYQKIYDDLLSKDKISKEVSQKLTTESKENIKKFDEIFKHSYKTKELADKVSTEAKKLYDKLYRASAGKSQERNSCKDFVL